MTHYSLIIITGTCFMQQAVQNALLHINVKSNEDLNAVDFIHFETRYIG